MGCKRVFCDSPVGESKEFIMSNYFDPPPPFNKPLACAKSIKFEMDDQLLGANSRRFLFDSAQSENRYFWNMYF